MTFSITISLNSQSNLILNKGISFSMPNVDLKPAPAFTNQYNTVCPLKYVAPSFSGEVAELIQSTRENFHIRIKKNFL
jgi:hypothetical protein